MRITWHDVQIQRSSRYPGRSHSNPFTIHRNPIADPNIGHYTFRWDRKNPETQPFYAAWVASVLPGDLIQLVPKAFGQGWTNIVSEASIKVHYDEADASSNHDGQSSEMTSPSYHNTNRLDSNKRQIRLLVVDQGAFSDPIIAQFETVFLSGNETNNESLPSAPEFWALSYCWGDFNEPAQPSLRNGVSNGDGNDMSEISVSQHVAAAIRRLRTSDKPLRIWIDTICINQEDMIERSEQVGIMNIIYQTAAEVHVWSGEDGQTAKSTLPIIRDPSNVFDQASETACPGADQCTCPEGWQHMINRAAFLADRQKDHPDIYAMDAIFHMYREYFASGFYAPDVASSEYSLAILMNELFGHPWFWRVWVIQEATLAKNATVHCGREMASKMARCDAIPRPA